MTRSIRRLLAPALTVLLLGGAAASLSACNTVRGAGQDVSSVGHDVTNGAVAAGQGAAHP